MTYNEFFENICQSGESVSCPDGVCLRSKLGPVSTICQPCDLRFRPRLFLFLLLFGKSSLQGTNCKASSLKISNQGRRNSRPVSVCV